MTLIEQIELVGEACQSCTNILFFSQDLGIILLSFTPIYDDT